MPKYLLSTHTIRIKNRKSDEYYPLGNVDGTDFLKIFNDFIEALAKNPRSFNNSSSKDDEVKKTTLRLGEGYQRKKKKRICYGNFESGVSGKEGTINDIESNTDVFKMKTKHARMQPLFFLLDIVEYEKTGYLILQRKSTFGIKMLFERSIKTFLREQGLKDIEFEIKNILLPRVFDNMLEKGRVKSLSFFTLDVPKEIDDIVDEKGLDFRKFNLKTEKKITSNKGLPVKGFLKRLFYKEIKRNLIEVDGSDQEYEDISFTLTEGNNQKTYYAKQRNKTLPDLDITRDRDIRYDDDKKPTIESLVKIAKREINEMKKLINVNKDIQ